MTENQVDGAPDLIDLTGEIVAAYVANNSVPVSELPNLIQGVHGAIAMLTSGSTPSSLATPAVEFERPSAAQIRKSVRPDGIVSFIDGKTYKTLKRHLTSHGLDPRAYRDRYGLAADYPMVASSYAEQRSALARSIGLGQVGGRTPQGKTGTEG